VSERPKIGDRVRLTTAPGLGVLLVEDSEHNRNPWSCTRRCSDGDCSELNLLGNDGGIIHANECEMVPA
jgi:hypothetical protein